MSGQPELITPRLRVRPLRPEDVDAAAPLYDDPEVNRFVHGSAHDRAGAREQVTRRLAVPAPPGMGHWLLELDGAVVGLVKLLPSAELPDGLPEVGWRLAREQWGRGLATEAVRALLDHGFDALGLPAIWALVHQKNAASLVLAARLGFHDVGAGPEDRLDQRVLVALPGMAGALHHVELWVGDLERSRASLGWLLGELGWRPERRWRDGASWRRGNTYLVVEASPARHGDGHDRLRPGLNHFALHVTDAARVDELTESAVRRGWTLLFPGRHPHAGGEHQYAAYLSDPDGFEVELVAMPTPGEEPSEGPN